MKQKLFNFLCNVINSSLVSVYDAHDCTIYTVEYKTDTETTTLYFVARCCIISVNNIYIEYALYTSKDFNEPANPPVYSATRPLISTKETDKKLPLETRRLEKLIQLCSKKIIAQELEAQKNHMIKSIYNANTHM